MPSWRARLENQKIIKQMSSWRETNLGVKILIAIAVLFLLALLTFILVNLLAKSELNQKLDKLKSAGEPVSIEDIRPAPVLDKDNAALVYKKIFVLMTTKAKPFTMQDSGDLKPQIDKLETYYCGKTSIDDLSKAKKAEIYSILDSRIINSIIKLAEQAVEKPKSNFDLEYEEGYNMLLPHLNPYRQLARLLAVKVWQLANQGKPEAALKLCIAGLKLSRHIKDEPVLISQLVYYSCSAIILDQLNKIIIKHGISNQQRAEISKILNSQNLRKSMKTAIQGERAMSLHSIFNPALAGKIVSGETKNMNFLGLGIYKFIIKKDYVCYLKLMSQYIALYDKKYWLIPAAEKDDKTWTDRIEKIPFYCIYTRMLCPALDLPRQKTAKCQSLFDKAIIAMALEKYKKKNAKYPGTLAELGNNLPKDPFTGKDFSYQLQGKSYKLASAGDKKEKRRPRK